MIVFVVEVLRRIVAIIAEKGAIVLDAVALGAMVTGPVVGTLMGNTFGILCISGVKTRRSRLHNFRFLFRFSDIPQLINIHILISTPPVLHNPHSKPYCLRRH